jgi:Amt family ammonium transporter
MRTRLLACLLLTAVLAAVCVSTGAFAQEEAAAEAAAVVVEAAPAAEAVPDPLQALTDNASAMRIGLDTVWVLVAGMLVFWMNAGFALVESGLARAKNCTNILAKNFVVFAASTISFWVLGWGLMFGDGTPYVGTSGLWFVGGADNSPALGEAYASMNPFSTATYEGVYGAINWTPVPL